MRAANVVAAAAIMAAFLLRVWTVGVVDALAEMAGVAHYEWYARWRTAYSPLHIEVFASPPRLHEWLHPPLYAALRRGPQQLEALYALATPEGDGVFSLPLLTPAFCRLLSEEMRHFAATGANGAPPNDMNEHGVALADVGLGELAGALTVQVLTPLAAALFAREAEGARGGQPYGPRPTEEEAAEAAAAVEGTCCQSHHAFVVEYDAAGQPGLDMHHDASDVTLNVNLAAEGVRGGQLHFCGFAGWPHHRRHSFAYQHQVGRAVIHLGSHRHGAANVTHGLRQNLILWGRAAAASDGGYMASRPTRLHPHELPPDTRCLSWTHDADYEQYLPLPAVALRRREKQREQAELMDLVRQVTDSQISKLPEKYQAIVRMLRHSQTSQPSENITVE
ncbi:hypothetical protein AB1Y20_019392 [Prymnesium parvum]|uniref:Fe2OG dioxygenase domain-containing protein n=1 Tax=Prymnesium parvum TaxID=97485 RepID=A0AB34JUC8_PRYPA